VTGTLSRPAAGISDRTLDILTSRYERGEIGKEEFGQKKRDLRA